MLAMPSDKTKGMKSSAMNGITRNGKCAKHCNVCATNHAQSIAAHNKTKNRKIPKLDLEGHVS
jgi:excinuclease UvrABC helicase subunit UvrB